MSLSRRSFIKLTGTTAVCTCIGSLGTGGCGGNPRSSTLTAPAGSHRVQDGRAYFSLSELGTLLSVDGAVKFTVGDVTGTEHKVIVVRPGEADYRAFANACTHNGKELDYLVRRTTGHLPMHARIMARSWTTCTMRACWPAAVVARGLIWLDR